MCRPVRRSFDLRPLGHPVWWGALALLTANDHLFKHAGILPGWLTGKLSDVAFLIVAPVLFAALLPAAWRARQAIALVAVGGLFAAAKISTSVSNLLVAALGHVGIVWRLWPDPTDLVAFAVIPITLSVMRGPVRAVPSRRRREQAGVVLGALACVATSAPPRYPHNAFLLNAASDPTSVKITWLLRAVPCGMQTIDQPGQGSPVPADVAPALAASLTPGDLDDPFEVGLASGQVAALDGQPTTAGTCTTNTSLEWTVQCVGAILEAPAAAPVLMVALARWEESDAGGSFLSCDSPPSPTSRCKPMLDPKVDAGPDAVTLKTVDGVLQFVAGAKVRLAPVDPAAIAGRVVPPGSCRALREQYESLLQPQTCQSDADCVAVASVPVPGAPPVCAVNANLVGGRALSALGHAWTTGCVSAPAAWCGAPQPAVCRDGACAAVCPGEQLPSCPGPCYGDGGVSGTSCVQAGSSCVRPDGLICSCASGQTACGSAQPFSATCPLSCNDWPGGGSFVGGRIVHPSLDGGVGGDAASPSLDGASASPPDGGRDAARD